MKNIIATTLTLLVIGMFLTTNPTIAGDKVRAYQMAESGVSVYCPVKTYSKVAAEAVAIKNYTDDLKM